MPEVQDGMDVQTAVEASEAGFFALKVSEIERLTPDAVTVTFEVPAVLAETFRFRAGQHLALRRVVDGAEQRRTYSVCSSAVDGPLRVAVKRLEGGAFSPWATDGLRVGDTVDVLPPGGSFGPTLDPGRTRRYGLIAAGSGITPVISIAATALAVEPASSVVLLFGNRTTRDVMFLDELADLKDRHPGRFELLHLLSREEQESELLSGRIDPDRLRRLFATLVPPEQVDEWYVCGPMEMVVNARATLLEAGVPATAVHLELFHAEPAAPRQRRSSAPGSAAVVTALLHGRATVLEVEPDGPAVLDALLAVRPDAPYACKGGVCGTCRALVVEGEVEMDVNYALEPDELERGVVLTCQAHPVTGTVRLEYL